MKFFNILLGAATASSALAVPTPNALTSTKTDKRASKFKFVGVNQSGAEFGKNSLPGKLGKDYTWPVRSSIDVSEGRGSLPTQKLMLVDTCWQRDEHFPHPIYDVRSKLSCCCQEGNTNKKGSGSASSPISSLVASMLPMPRGCPMYV